MQCAVILAESCLNLWRLFLELIAEHPRTQHSCQTKMNRRILIDDIRELLDPRDLTKHQYMITSESEVQRRQLISIAVDYDFKNPDVVVRVLHDGKECTSKSWTDDNVALTLIFPNLMIFVFHD